MALTTNHTNNEVIKFREDLFFDFLRSSRLDAFMGKTSMSPIVQLMDLEAGGKEIHVPLVNQMSGSGVGGGTLAGNEEQIDSYGFPVWPGLARNAAAFNMMVKREPSYNLDTVSRQLIRNWAKRTIRDDLYDSLLSIPTATIQADRFGNPGNRVNGIRWSAATAAQKNAYALANYDRLLFGSAVANYSSTFATAVGNIDSTNDKMSAAVGSLAKSIAQQTGVSASNPGIYNGRPKINPWMIESDNIRGAGAKDQEWFLCLSGSRGFRDLKADTVMTQANREARSREGQDPTKLNPLFTGGALVYDGVIYLEIPEITQRLLLTGVGNGGIDVEPFFLLGQGALAHAVAQMPRSTKRGETDYDFITGNGTDAIYGVAKIAKAPLAGGDLVDWGMVTGFVAGVANA